MIGAKSYSPGFFRVKFKEIHGKDGEVIEKNEIEARKLYTILRKVTDAKLFKLTDSGRSKQIA